MSRFLAFVLSLLIVGGVLARERPVTSCDKAPLLADFQKQLPDHILATAADAQPKLLSKLPRFAVPILRRAGTPLVCVVIALDATGKAKDAAASYPIGFTLTAKEREQILSLQWSAAQLAGNARPSLVNMSVSSL